MNRNVIFVVILFLVLLLLFVPANGVQAAGTLYVMETGGLTAGPCDDWSAACTLDHALFTAVANDEIWVQKGTYVPGVAAADSFLLPDAVSIYGGFSGVELVRDDRDPDPNLTILSGGGGVRYSVVSINSHSLLDGFTISGGKADDTGGGYDRGGGIFCTGTSLGGPIVHATPTFVNVIFKNNVALGNGGAFYGHACDAIFADVTFESNVSSASGGAVYNLDGVMKYSEVTFFDNQAYFGGGVYNDTSDTVTLENVAFSGNNAGNSGGAIYNYDSDIFLDTVSFVRNYAGVGGGGIGNRLSSPTIINSSFSSNQADGAGFGGGIANELSAPTINNSILWGNGSLAGGESQVHTHGAPTYLATINQSIVEGGCPAGASCGVAMLVMDSDPLFVLQPLSYHDPSIDPVAIWGDLHLRPSSPAVNVGDNTEVTVAEDLDGNTRVFGPNVDLGGFELQFDPNTNTTWPRAQEMILSGPSDWQVATADQAINARGESRWYKFSVAPGSRVAIRLSNLVNNYDLTLYSDIQAAYDSLLEPQNLDELTELTAEFAPDAYAPDAYAPDAYAPDAYAPDAYAPDAYAPDAYAPDAYAPDAYAPDAYAPDAYAPDAYAPDAYAPDAYAPDAYAPDTYAPDAYAPDVAYTSAQMNSLIAVSALDGQSGELIGVNTWDHTGDFYVRVKGRNGAYNPTTPFHLLVAQSSGACSDLNLVLPSPNSATSNNFKTLILTDFGRMNLDATAIAEITTRLDNLIVRPEVAGVVVDVGSDPDITHYNQEADQILNLQCPYAKNMVARSIKEIIDAYWSQNATLENVVLIGHDDILPFFRYPDRAMLASEKNYNPPVRDDSTSYTSLALGYVLSQDFYGAKLEFNRSSSSLPLPHLAIGRLVETPAEIMTVLDAYLADSDGVIVPSTSLVTGYDFLADVAEAINSELVAGLGTGATTETLISERNVGPNDGAWTADQLRALLFGGRHDITFLAGHFSANSALAADYSTHLLTSDLANAAVDMTNVIVFSAGCHAGYNIVDPHGVPNVTIELDWAQAFAGKGASLIAGTGYQYGDTDFMEYSERLYHYFSRQLRAGTGPVSIGQALVKAKQEYLATTPELRGIHEKALMEATLFGLPMLSFNMQGTRYNPSVDTSIVTSITPVLSKPGAVLGLKYADVPVNPMLTARVKSLDRITRGSTQIIAGYFEGGDGVVTRPGEPVLPLELHNVTYSGQVLRGIGFRGASYSDYNNFIPLTGAPATELRGIHPPFWSDVFFPIKPYNANYFDVLSKIGSSSTGITKLALTPAQFKSDAPDGYVGTMRTLDTVDFRFYYSANITKTLKGNVPALASPPSINKVNASAKPGKVEFEVIVLGDLSAGIQEVWVTYTCVDSADTGCYGQWQSLDLSQHPRDSRLWVGTLTLPAGVPEANLRYMVQGVNGVGLVSLNSNLGRYFTPNVDSAVPPVTGIPTTVTLLRPTTAYYGEQVILSARLKDVKGYDVSGQDVVFAMGGQRRRATTNATGYAEVSLPILSPPGEYKIWAGFGGSHLYQPSADYGEITVHKQPTTLSLPSDPFVIDTGDNINIALRGSHGRPLVEKRIFVVVQGATGSWVQSLITNYLGNARVSTAALPIGSYQVGAFFLGSFTLPGGRVITLSDPNYSASSVSGDFHITEVQSVTADVDPVIVDGTVNASATLSVGDLAAADITASWDWGDDSGTAGTVVDTASGEVTVYGNHEYQAAGVYTVKLSLFYIINDEEFPFHEAEFQYVVIYDPSEGFVTGGGWINSPEGAYTADPTLTGKGNFGFVSKYKKGATVPTGETEFRFNAGDLDFHSTEYQWLVIAGSKAKFKGWGTINGEGDYGFMISAIDAKLANNTDDDLFRIKIWDETTGLVVYDNQIDASEDADPTTALGGGSITIHKSKK